VDGTAQIIVAAAVTQEADDTAELVPMLQQVEANLDQKPTQASADADYFSATHVTDTTLQGIDLYVPPDRQTHGGPAPAGSAPPPPDAPTIAQMRHKLQTAAGQAVYALRKAIVEPVFGQIKAARGFRRFAFRGQAKVTAEWLLICLTHNLLKLFRAGACPQQVRGREKGDPVCGAYMRCALAIAPVPRFGHRAPTLQRYQRDYSDRLLDLF